MPLKKNITVKKHCSISIVKFTNFFKNLEVFLFYFLIFSLPFQKRAIIYSWGSGFNEWTSAYLYFTDMLIAVIFILWLYRRPISEIKSKIDIALLVFLSLAGFSLIEADNLYLGIYQWFKLLEFTLLFFYIKYNFSSIFNFKTFLKVVLASGILQAGIAITQFFYQKSLNLYTLEESILGPQLSGVAKIDMPGFEIMRAYGTFPHANPLAVFLIISLICLAVFYNFLRPIKFLSKLFFIIVSWLFILTLFLTFSRTIIILGLIGIAIYCLVSKNKFLSRVFIGEAIILVYLLYPEFINRFNPMTIVDSQAVDLRLFYNQIAFSLIKQSPLMGIGLGNFVWHLPSTINDISLVRQAIAKDGFGSWIYQPVHNVFLLIGGEIGLAGLAVFIYFLFSVIKNFLKQQGLSLLKIFCLSSFLILFFVDHYFWTLQQGSLLLWIGLGMLAVFSEKNSTFFI